MVRGQAALRFTGMAGKPVVNVENACATGSTAFWLAYNAVRSGQADVAIAIGAERMTHADKAVSLGALAKAVDLEEKMPEHMGKGSGSIFMDHYAEKTRKYMAATGARARTSPRSWSRAAMPRRSTRWPSSAARPPSKRCSAAVSSATR
ncbi:hypothetical protein AU476_36185 [Cupriavidus sp. UYMSc13B]|nr:hypothetical protein AU476_36185 [Cupriavidus sp. UYMSc13B]